MKTIISLIIVLILTGCIAGERVRQSMAPGMSQDQVTQIMGKPDGFQQRGEYVTYKYTNVLISGWGHDRTDYSFIFKNDKLVEYGTGEVRERNVGGIHSLFIY